MENEILTEEKSLVENEQPSEKEKKVEKKKFMNSKKATIVAAALLALVVVIGLGVKVYIDNRNDISIDNPSIPSGNNGNIEFDYSVLGESFLLSGDFKPGTIVRVIYSGLAKNGFKLKISKLISRDYYYVLDPKFDGVTGAVSLNNGFEAVKFSSYDQIEQYLIKDESGSSEEGAEENPGEIVEEPVTKGEIPVSYDTVTIDGVSYVDVTKRGCIYDGSSDDSVQIMSISENELYFPAGRIALTRAAVQFLGNKSIKGEGEIVILDPYTWPRTKYANNNCILVSDFYNPYINSTILPNVINPATEDKSQNVSGCITSNYMAGEGYHLRSLSCWGQVYPIAYCSLADDDIVTICLGKMDYYYLKDGVWEELTETSYKVPANSALHSNVWGFYDRNFGKNPFYEDAGFISLSSGAISVTDCGSYVEYAFKFSTIKNRVLHFGLDSHLMPTRDPELYVKGSFSVWVKEPQYANLFVANIGFDAYVDADDGSYTKKVNEYVVSRCTPVTTVPSEVVVAYTKGDYSVLR